MSSRRAFALCVLVAASRSSIIDDLPDVAEGEEDELSEPYGGYHMPGMDEMHVHTAGAYGEVEGWDFYGNDGEFDAYSGADREPALSGLFRRLDTDADGRVGRAELRAGLVARTAAYEAAAQAARRDEAQRVLLESDADGDGRLSADEFEAADALYLQHEDTLARAEAFAFGDGWSAGGEATRVADGFIDEEELLGLIFPEGERLAGLGRLVASRVLAQQPRGPDGEPPTHLDVDALFAWHRARRRAELGVDGGGGGGGGHGGADEDEDEDEMGYGMPELSRHEIVEGFALADADEDGKLDAAELAAYLLPAPPQPSAEDYEEEASHLLAHADAQGGFDLPGLLERSGDEWAEAFQRELIEEAARAGQSEPRDEL